MRLFGDDRVIDRTRATHYVNPAMFENWINDRHQILINWYDYFKEKYDQVVEDGAMAVFSFMASRRKSTLSLQIIVKNQ